MKNLWHFLVRYNAFFWFLVFFVFSVILVVRHNNFQRTSFINSSNVVVGNYYKNVNSWMSYLNLADNNAKLLEENALLRKKLEAYTQIDSTRVSIVDSIEMDRYDFIVATVIMVRPYQTAIDFSVTTESIIPFDFGYSTKVIHHLYELVGRDLQVLDKR